MLSQLITECRQDCQELSDYLQEIIDWANHVATRKLPRVVEARRRLRIVQSKLDLIFAKEAEVVSQIERARGATSEFEAMKTRTERDQFHLRQRLASLVLRLERAEAEFEDWKPVLYELNLFWDAMEQHGEWYCECAGWITPPSEMTPDNSKKIQ